MRVSPGSNKVSKQLTSRVEDFWKSKIDYFYIWVLILILEKEVLWLQISVTHTRIVAVVNGLQDLFKDPSSFSLGEILFLKDSVEKFSSSASLHAQEYIIIVFKILIKFDHIGMVLKN